jgi:hypothetical protein
VAVQAELTFPSSAEMDSDESSEFLSQDRSNGHENRSPPRETEDSADDDEVENAETTSRESSSEEEADSVGRVPTKRK